MRNVRSWLNTLSLSRYLSSGRFAKGAPRNLGVTQCHTAGLDTIFIQIYMDVPPGMPGVLKELEGHKDQYLDVFLR